ncbi:sodium-dependent transporter [Corynebacterium heidelbergense]|uniref:Transporter n=1 Tax=Corynebacterium heidelbergense TaxID=2055947 RepID=A0A364V5J7_9CORY|nr:sodium-dependent transporter [Corynebacterium heidelbergense]RAV31899.1 sodium-dependent transporter [Corynebacterium heidelbergense]
MTPPREPQPTPKPSDPRPATADRRPESTGGREQFNTRFVFLMAAIGSAVGLGNIWRFPYVAYDNGGGAFLIPYLVALLTAGIPLLWFYFAVGHRYRASAPLAYRRINRSGEFIGWIKVGVAFFITLYYAAIIAWAALYAVKSVSKAWGSDPSTYLMSDFLQVDKTHTFSTNYVVPILITMVLVWILTTVTLATDVNKGIGKVTSVFVPLLVVLFVIIVVRALFLDGASTGLEAFFHPNWSALKDSGVWISAYGQIFFSLSIGFGIMTTYASYLKPRTNLTGTGMVTAFANSSFEVLAGIGVFAALGFMANQQGVAVKDVASNGVGLAFIAFPTIINEMPLGGLFGVLFFASLFLAGITSLISLMEVVLSAVRDKLNTSRRTTAIALGTIMGILSVALFASTSGLIALDIMDKWTNNIGIVCAAILSLVATGWVFNRRRELQQHLNAVSSVRVGAVWQFCTFILTPLVLLYTVINEIRGLLREPYEGYASASLSLYGWMVIAVIVVAAMVLSVIPFHRQQSVDGVVGSDYGVPQHGRPADEPNHLLPQSTAETAAQKE